MKKILIYTPGFLLWSVLVQAQQNTAAMPEIVMTEDKKYENVFTFEVINEPPLEQTSGAPEAFYDYFWEFGDGNYSFEENPTHSYTDFGDGDVLVALTNNYSNGGAPPTRPKKKRKKKDQPPPPDNTTLASNWKKGDPINTSLRDDETIDLITNHSPRPGDPMVTVLSYKNNGQLGISPQLPQNGRLYLFYNEKAFSYRNFQFQGSRQHAGEIVSQGLPIDGLTHHDPTLNNDLWASAEAPIPHLSRATLPVLGEHKDIVIQRAVEKYENVLTWEFKDLQKDEVRNIFATFLTTPEMIRDTTATITFQAIMVPETSVIAESNTLALTVQASHDPNKMYVSTRHIKKKDIFREGLIYTIKFQNVGRGPASNIMIENKIHRSLDPASIRILDQYPKTNWCDRSDSLSVTSCHDTLISKGMITWKFNNVYLPGRRQKDRESKKATKGWIEYSIKPKKRLKGRKLAGRSHIYFDRNAPIATNQVKTRIDKDWSISLKAGLNDISSDYKHYFGGITWAPFRPRGFFNQSEIMLAEQGYGFLQTEMEVPLDIDATGNTLFGDRISDYKYSLTYIDVVPFQIRKNLLRIVGVGAGVQLSLLARVEEDLHIRRIFYQTGLAEEMEDISTRVVDLFDGTRDSRFNIVEPGIFLDVNAGLMIKGPSGGVRMIWKNNKRPVAGSGEEPSSEVRTTIQVYFQFKL